MQSKHENCLMDGKNRSGKNKRDNNDLNFFWATKLINFMFLSMVSAGCIKQLFRSPFKFTLCSNGFVSNNQPT